MSLSSIQRTGTPLSLVLGGFSFRVTALHPMDVQTDGWTDGRMDGRKNGWTDRPSYRDVRTHLKRLNYVESNQWSKKHYVSQSNNLTNQQIGYWINEISEKVFIITYGISSMHVASSKLLI